MAIWADTRDGAIIFRDLVGKLDVLNVECEKCGRRGRYHLHRLIERHGIDAKLFDWSDEIGRLPAEAGARFKRPVRRPLPGFVEGCLNALRPAMVVHELELATDYLSHVN